MKKAFIGLHVEIPTGTHRQLRQLCANTGLTAADVVRALLNEALTRETASRPPIDAVRL